MFVPSRWHLDQTAERAIYDLHRNAADDPGYRRFLGRAVGPLLDALKVPSDGLDFGCGPVPVAAEMIEAQGHRCAAYDPYYRPDSSVLAEVRDFVLSTEVFEHLSEPGVVFEQLVSRLRPGGVMVVMTKRVRDREAFARWHYRHDPTHVAFFSAATFAWLARRHGLELELIGADVVRFHVGSCREATRQAREDR
ncbi:MAG: class I SAM-dependent methyltransferase [Halothiobacillaceae bacterium]